MNCVARRTGLHLLEFWENDSFTVWEAADGDMLYMIALDPNTTHTPPFPRMLILIL